MPRRACWLALILALTGMVWGCGVARLPPAHPDDGPIDTVWLALRRGDPLAATVAADAMTDPDFRQRALLDVRALREGRAATLVASREQGAWLAPRYRASDELAREELEQDRAAHGASAVYWLELARRAGSGTRRRASARRAALLGAGGAEALATLAEELLAQRRFSELSQLLERLPEGGAHLRWIRRRFAAATGRAVTALDGLLSDLEQSQAPPQALELMGRLLQALPNTDAERRARELLLNDREEGGSWVAARARLLTRLERRDAGPREGEPALGLAWADTPAALASRRRARLRAGGTAAANSPEMRCDLDPRRPDSKACLSLRLTSEWSLAARESYRDAARGTSRGLSEFLALLDQAALPLGSVSSLAELPRRSFGVFGEMLDTAELSTAWPGLFVLAGRGLGQPPELTCYDLISRERVSDSRAIDGAYDRCMVRQLRVPGRAAAAGGRFTGAGLIHTVFLDNDQVTFDARQDRARRLGPELSPWAAHDRAARRALSEPLDCAARLTAAAVADGGEDYGARVLAALQLHEAQHIADAGRFLRANLFEKLGELLGAGLLPGAVRAELEQRAQLAALREAPDARIPLADMVALVPVQGARRLSEHARGYAALLRQFVARLDQGDWDGARPLEQLGLLPDHVLVQQLWRLDPEVIRAVARSLPLD